MKLSDKDLQKMMKFVLEHKETIETVLHFLNEQDNKADTEKASDGINNTESMDGEGTEAIINEDDEEEAINEGDAEKAGTEGTSDGVDYPDVGDGTGVEGETLHESIGNSGAFSKYFQKDIKVDGDAYAFKDSTSKDFNQSIKASAEDLKPFIQGLEKLESIGAVAMAYTYVNDTIDLHIVLDHEAIGIQSENNDAVEWFYTIDPQGHNRWSIFEGFNPEAADVLPDQDYDKLYSLYTKVTSGSTSLEETSGAGTASAPAPGGAAAPLAGGPGANTANTGVARVKAPLGKKVDDEGSNVARRYDESKACETEEDVKAMMESWKNRNGWQNLYL